MAFVVEGQQLIWNAGTIEVAHRGLGERVEADAAKLLAGLGFTEDVFTKAMRTLLKVVAAREGESISLEIV